jgi:hypothetical protein
MKAFRFSMSTIPLLVATALVVFSAANLRAQSAAACAAISESDLAPFVGSAPMESSPGGCSWNADKNHFLQILDNSPKTRDVAAVFNMTRAATSKNQTVTDESGLGDKAFLSIATSGLATFQILKKDRFLQVQMWVGAQPSVANLTLLRVIAAKAIAAF